MFLLALVSLAHAAPEPVRVVEDALSVPEGIDPEIALDSVSDIARVFELYEPRVPRVPGLRLDLDKEVVFAGAPTVLELPVSGNVAGRSIDELARVTATVTLISCGMQPGRLITLDFEDSTHNIARRIDRIEIEACLDPSATGETQMSAVGRMYEGYLPQDPSKDALMESIGSRAVQGAFLRQVQPILDAVEAHWATTDRRSGTAPSP